LVLTSKKKIKKAIVKGWKDDKITISAYLGTVTSCHISITLASKYENIRKEYTLS
jgi:hypothetical protein